MVDKTLVGIGVLVLVLLLYLLLCKIWHFTRTHHKVDEVTEFLIPEDLSVGQTQRSPTVVRWNADVDIDVSNDNHFNPSIVCIEEDHPPVSRAEDVSIQCSKLTLEVISGPSTGVNISHESEGICNLSLRIGRVPQNDLVVNDPEVSGKHAVVNWNSKNSKWELIDLGSLNGTLLNSQPVSTQDSNSRQRSDPVRLASGDIVTLGLTSKVLVKIVDHDDSNFSIHSIPFGVGVASNPMTMRRGGKQLPMEDVCHCEWPLRGISQFGVFCIFDGHGGADAAKAASKIMPQKLADILFIPGKKEQVISNCNAADVLRDAFQETEAALDYQYEGCTATVLLLWHDFNEVFFAQCANVGDSACIFNIEENHISMTEDHRLISLSEKTRMLEIGKQLRDGETRLWGMNIARVLGDKFFKEQDIRFSAEPYISEVLRITRESNALALMASDGLWDVLSTRSALQLALEVREEKFTSEGPNVSCAEGIANMIVKEAQRLRTKDNTSVIVLDFGTRNKSCNVLDCNQIETISMYN
ncbi:protein phosphatase 2C 70 isoform X2 [Cryptomeria japonica]|uniref:protein phosphatase 2C 70 isoform X2 n=1 Tax=Cryptomeria japonica TaxID=3369 RepID=UPI0027DA5C0D|nr:protein phosphatase 2C 70 isoform X2 [Cryptomeria japonica]